MTQRARVWTVAACSLLTVVVLAAILVPVPFLLRSPGPVFDLLGEADGEPVLEVSGTQTYSATGELDLTTVAESGGPAGSLTSGAALLGWLSPTATLLYDSERRDESDRQADVAVFDASLSQAQAAAANFLDRPVSSEPVVVSVRAESPADGVLEPKDEIVAVNDQRVSDGAQVAEAIQKQPAGTKFTLSIVQNGEKVTAEVVSEFSPELDRPVIGVVVENVYTTDFEAQLNLDGIGGPSAGTMLAVALVDKLTPEELVAGRHIAGTGTISAEGQVGEIGGIQKKMVAAAGEGAQLFIAPESNCEDVVGAVPDGLVVAAVKNLDDTITAIGDWQADRQVKGCPSAADRAERR